MGMFGGIGPSLISGGASLIGGLMGNSSAKSIAREQMDFQERMSRRKHRYEVNDLRGAGLNPVLSATYGMGSNSPSGAMASIPNANPIGDAVNSAMEAKRLSAELDNIEADTKLKSDSALAQRAGAAASASAASLNATVDRQKQAWDAWYEGIGDIFTSQKKTADRMADDYRRDGFMHSKMPILQGIFKQLGFGNSAKAVGR